VAKERFLKRRYQLRGNILGIEVEHCWRIRRDYIKWREQDDEDVRVTGGIGTPSMAESVASKKGVRVPR
jgi:hypothetical protein